MTDTKVDLNKKEENSHPAETEPAPENTAHAEASEPSPDQASAPPQTEAESTQAPPPPKAPEPAKSEPAPAPVPYQGRFNACFDGLSRIGPLALLAALFCMAWPIFWQPANGVYCPAEIKFLTSFLHCLADGSWLAPTGLDNGAWTLAQWPVFNWVVGLMALSPGLVQTGYLLPTTAFLCTFFAVLGVWCLAHAAGFGFRAAFAAGLILLCAPLFAPLPNFVGPATLAAGFFLFALVFFCRGWRGHASWFSLPLAFVLTTIAGLTGGLLHFIVPLGASFCYLIWRGELRRAHKADAIFGYILMLLIIGCWLGAIMLYHVNDSYLALLFGQAWQWGWPIPLKWLIPIAAGILGTMPWILMIFGVSWFKVLANSGHTLKLSRHENGSALIWISLALALPIALFVPWFHPSGVAIACLVAILLGKAATHLTDAGSRFFYLLASLCLIIAGLVLLCVSFESTQSFILDLLPALPVPDLGGKLLSLSMLPIIGGIVLLGGIIALMFVKRFSGMGPLVYAILLVIIICQPARLKLVPELTVMPGSPLVSYSQISAQVEAALAPQSASTSAPAIQEPEAPAQAPETPAQELATPPAAEPPAYSVPQPPQEAASPPAVEEPGSTVPQAPVESGAAPASEPEAAAPQLEQPGEAAPAPEKGDVEVAPVQPAQENSQETIPQPGPEETPGQEEAPVQMSEPAPAQ